MLGLSPFQIAAVVVVAVLLLAWANWGTIRKLLPAGQVKTALDAADMYLDRKSTSGALAAAAKQFDDHGDAESANQCRALAGKVWLWKETT